MCYTLIETKNNYEIYEKKNAFTLIELMVTLIIAAISGFVIVTAMSHVFADREKNKSQAQVLEALAFNISHATERLELAAKIEWRHSDQYLTATFPEMIDGVGFDTNTVFRKICRYDVYLTNDYNLKQISYSLENGVTNSIIQDLVFVSNPDLELIVTNFNYVPGANDDTAYLEVAGYYERQLPHSKVEVNDVSFKKWFRMYNK